VPNAKSDTDTQTGSFGGDKTVNIPPLRYLVQYQNGTKDLNATWENIKWSQVERVGIGNGLCVGGFEKNYGSIVWYLNQTKGVTFSQPIFYTYQRFWAKIGGTWYRKYLTTNITKTPWKNEVTADNWIIGWKGELNYGSYLFPVSLGLKLRTGDGFANLKTNVTTPLNLDNTALEYQLVLNPYYVGDAQREIRWVRVYNKSGGYSDYSIKQFLNITTDIPNLVSSFTFLNNDKSIEICYFNFTDVFSLGISKFAQIEQVTLPSGITTYVLKIGVTFGSLNAGETLVIDPTFGNTVTGSYWVTLSFDAPSTTDYIRGIKASPNNDGTLSSIKAYLRWTPSGTAPHTVKAKAAIYFSSNSSLVGGSAGQSNEITLSSSSAQWWTFTFASPPDVVGGVEYLIVVSGEGKDKFGDQVLVEIAYSTTVTGIGRYQTNEYTGTFPDPASFSTHDVKYSIYAEYTLANSNPTVGEWDITPGSPGDTIYAWQDFNISLKVQDTDNKEDIQNVTIGFMNANYSWNENTGVWSTVTANSRINFVTGNCANLTVNSTSYEVVFAFQIYWNGTDGSISLWAKVFDDSDASATSTYSGLFTFESDLIVSSASSNDTRCNPSDGLNFTGWIFYQGTTTSPYSSTDLTVYAELSGTSKGTDSTLTGNGNFSITFSSEFTPASYSYNVYVLTDETSIQNQTVNVIVDRLVISWKGNDDPRRNNGTAGEIRFKIKSEVDGTMVQAGSVTINGTISASWDSVNSWWDVSTGTVNSVGLKSYVVTAVTWSTYDITTLNSGVSTNATSIIWDRDTLDNFSFSGGTFFNLTVRAVSLYDGVLNSKNIRIRVYRNGTLLNTYDSMTNSTGYVTIATTKNLYGVGNLTFDCIDLDDSINSVDHTNYLFSFNIGAEIQTSSFAIDKTRYEVGESITFTCFMRSTAYINDSSTTWRLRLFNVSWSDKIYEADGTLYGTVNNNLFNTTYAYSFESQSANNPSLTVSFPEGSYYITKALYLSASSHFLTSVDTITFIVTKATPSSSSSGGPVSTASTQVLYVQVSDRFGTGISGASIKIIDSYNGTSAEGVTDSHGVATFSLASGNYTVSVTFQNVTQTKPVSIIDSPETLSFVLTITAPPVEVTIDYQSLLYLSFGSIFLGVAIISERKYKKTAIAIPTGFLSLGMILYGGLVGMSLVTPIFSLPEFSFTPIADLSSIPSVLTNFNLATLTSNTTIIGIVLIPIVFISIVIYYMRKPKKRAVIKRKRGVVVKRRL